MQRRYKLFLLLLLASFNSVWGQSTYRKTYDAYVSGNEIGSEKSISKLVDEQTSRYFIIISFFINSNNVMYEKTKDVKYLQSNEKVLKNFRTKNGTFKAKFNKNEQNYELNDKESSLLEGYLYRYMAQYYYILSGLDSKTLSRNGLNKDFGYVEDRFMYWYKASYNSTKDDSFLHGIRVHMGAQWATCALYLRKLTAKSENRDIYAKFLKRYDENLRANLHKKTVNKKPVYYWNATWDSDFTNSLKKRRKKHNENSEIQDTAHGSHVVEYIITAYELSYGQWSKKDIEYLANTLYELIYDKKNEVFSDLINGKNSSLKDIRDTGKKQTDGWMKLIKYDTRLKPVYEAYLKKNKKFLERTNYYNQYLSNLL